MMMMRKTIVLLFQDFVIPQNAFYVNKTQVYIRQIKKKSIGYTVRDLPKFQTAKEYNKMRLKKVVNITGG